MAEDVERREPGIREWLIMTLLGAALFTFGTLSARTGLPPQPETVAGPVFDQVAGLAVVGLGVFGLVPAVVARSRRRAVTPPPGRGLEAAPAAVGSTTTSRGRHAHRSTRVRPRSVAPGPSRQAPVRTRGGTR